MKLALASISLSEVYSLLLQLGILRVSGDLPIEVIWRVALLFSFDVLQEVFAPLCCPFNFTSVISDNK